MLIRGLPEDSALQRAEAPAWTIEHELLARNVEQTSAWLRLVAICLGAKPARLPEAHEVEHPDRRIGKEPPPLTTDPQQIYDFFRRRR